MLFWDKISLTSIILMLLLMRCRRNKLGLDFVNVSLLGLLNTFNIVFIDRLWDSTIDENHRYFEYAQQEHSTISVTCDVVRCSELGMI